MLNTAIIRGESGVEYVMDLATNRIVDIISPHGVSAGLLSSPLGGAAGGVAAVFAYNQDGSVAGLTAPSGGTVSKFGASSLTVGVLGDSIVQDAWAYGAISMVGTITGGTLYTAGYYPNVPLTGGQGTGAAANITVAGGKVTAVQIVSGGSGFQISDGPSCSAANIGGTGSGFSFYIEQINNINYNNPYVMNGGGTSANFIGWAAAYSMGRLRYIAACAQGGWTITQINDNLANLYLPYLPDITIVQIGFNDISGVTTYNDATNIVSTYQSKLIALVNQLKALGTTPVLCTISPKASDFSGFNIFNNRWIGIHNQWVRNYCAVNHIAMFDYANYVSDPSDTAGGGLFPSLFQRKGGVTAFGAITGGTLYTNGQYNNVTLTGGTGTGATANITVAGGAVTAVVLNGLVSQGICTGYNYTAADSLTTAAANIGGTGSGFAVVVSTVSTSHVHGGSEINRALGYELWTNLLSKMCPTSSPLNFNGYGVDGQSTYPGAGVNLAIGALSGGTPMFTGTAGTVTAPSTGTLPTGVTSWGNAGATAAYSVGASPAVALSTLNTTGLVNGGVAGNYAQCSIDTSVAANLYTVNQGVGISIPINFSYGGVLQFPQLVVARVRVKATALNNCAGIFMRITGGVGGGSVMTPVSNGITPQSQDASVVTTAYEIVIQSPPFYLPFGQGNSISLFVGAVIYKTGVGTTTFQVSQPEVVLLPIQIS